MIRVLTAISPTATIGKIPEGMATTTVSGICANEPFQVACGCPKAAQDACLTIELAGELAGGHAAREMAKETVALSQTPIQFVFGVQ